MAADPVAATPRPEAEAHRIEPQGTALPADWQDLWTRPDEEAPLIAWRRIESLSRTLADGIPLAQERDRFASLVGSEEMRAAPVHRWYTYKEGFSPDLLDEVIRALELEDGLTVADAFGGVGTTALSCLIHPKVAEVRSVEFSPFARFVGRTKLLWPDLDPDRLEELLAPALAYDNERPVRVPALAAFSNPAIFPHDRISALLRVREHLRELEDADGAERDFFLLGLAAVVEDLSGAMKDGRALRIKRGRSRRASSLAETKPAITTEGPIERALAGQWTAMIADLRVLQAEHESTQLAEAHHVAGDARELASVRLDDGTLAFPEGWATLSLFSPPYLNCIDYTELYKLELWLMEHIVDQESFRETRLGTLRSHPSVKFDPRAYFDDVAGPARELVDAIATWITEHGARPEIGRVVGTYFEDLLQVWREQLRILAPGAYAVCVVANSTFSRRDRVEDEAPTERWRLPLLTDVILGALAETAGFEEIQIWEARELRPRNVRGGRARESLVVARKAIE